MSGYIKSEDHDDQEENCISTVPCIAKGAFTNQAYDDGGEYTNAARCTTKGPFPVQVYFNIAFTDQSNNVKKEEGVYAEERDDECIPESNNVKKEEGVYAEDRDVECIPEYNNVKKEEGIYAEDRDDECIPEYNNVKKEEGVYAEERDDECIPESNNVKKEEGVYAEERDDECIPESDFESIREPVHETPREEHDSDTSIILPTVEETVKVQQSGIKKQKYHCCMYCKKLVQKLPRHFEQKHSAKERVREFVAEPKKSKKRRDLLLQMQHLGDFKYNFKTMKMGNGLLIPKYRPRPGEERLVEDLVPCSFCFGLYVKTDLWKHQKKCIRKEENDMSRSLPINKGILLLPQIAGCGMPKEIILTMRNDSLKKAILKDPILAEFGQSLCEKDGHLQHMLPHISQKLRELGRVLIEAQTNNSNISSILDCLRPSNWETLVEAVKTVAGYSYESGTYETPTLAIKVGNSLSRCATITESKAITMNDLQLQSDMEAFLSFYKNDWPELITAKAHSTIQCLKFNKPLLLPLVSDTVKLHLYLQKKMEELRIRTDVADKPRYKEMAEVCLTQVILFNRTRSGETQRIKVDQFLLKENDVDTEVQNSLTEFERKLCKTHKRIEIIGNKESKVPVLFTAEMEENIHLILRLRDKINITCPHLFAKPDSNFPLRGRDCLRKFANESGVKSKFTSPKLYEQIAVISQVIGLGEVNQNMLAAYLGHDIRVNCECYRLPEQTLQLAKVTKLLHMMNAGKLSKFQGQDFDSIAIDSIECTDESEEELSGGEVGVSNWEPKESTAKIQTRKRAALPKTYWSGEEESAAKRQLGHHFARGTLPGKTECLHAISQEKCLENRQWAQLKHFVRNKCAKMYK